MGGKGANFLYSNPLLGLERQLQIQDKMRKQPDCEIVKQGYRLAPGTRDHALGNSRSVTMNLDEQPLPLLKRSWIHPWLQLITN